MHVDNTDIGCSDHFLVWVELGRTAKNSKKGKPVLRRWRLDRFGDDEVKLRYQNGLRAEVHVILRERKVEGDPSLPSRTSLVVRGFLNPQPLF